MLPNGLYAVEMKTLDGVNAVATGVAVARDGVVMGGDPYFYYTGTYSCKDGRIKGELVTKQHTPYHGPAQLFYAGHEVGLGFSGTYEGDRAEVYGFSNVGRRTVSVHLKIRKLADAFVAMYELIIIKHSLTKWEWQVCDNKGNVRMQGFERKRRLAKYRGERALFLLLAARASGKS